MPRLTWLEIEGFRSFSVKQRLEFGQELALVWGGNSQGKTSVAEAIEFLLTGDTVRRTLLGGERSEYNDSLRCAHHPADEGVQVAAGLVDDDSTEHTVVRTLDGDLARGRDCTSTLTIDGNPAADLSSLGIVLAEPPLRAPVLFQHSVRYALTAGPTDRLAYFKALLEMADLDTLTRAIASAVRSFVAAKTDWEAELEIALADEDLRPSLEPLTTCAPSTAAVEARMRLGVAAAIKKLTGVDDDGANLTQLAGALAAVLDQQDQQRFDFPSWRAGKDPSLSSDLQLSQITEYARKAREVDAEAERLRALFQAVLAIPAYSDLEEAKDCPVCGTEDAMTPERIAELRGRVVSAANLHRAQQDASNELNVLKSQLQSAKNALASVVPSAASFDDEAVAAASSQAAAVLGEHADLTAARDNAKALSRSAAAASESTDEAMTAVDHALRAVQKMAAVDVEDLEKSVADAARAVAWAAADRTACVEQTTRVLTPLSQQLAAQGGTTSHRALLKLAGDADSVAAAVRKRWALTRVKREYEAAAREIEQAKLRVLNAKFTGMSGEIERWWKLLRPDEPVDFLKATPRGHGLRGVSLEVALHKGDGTHHTRDALGVFSDSQLNALGLAAFLARAALQESPLIVLDDPVQAGDEAHRDTFIDQVVPELLAAGFQVVITTYDFKLNQFLTATQQPDGFQVSLDEPVYGSVVVKGTHSARALLQEAKTFLHEGQAMRATCASRLRVAAEAVAKEVLVAKRSTEGDRASLADYTNHALEKLVPLLQKHVGDDEYRWWTTVSPRLSPGSHDDAPPEANTLRTVHNGLKKSVRDHL